MNRRDFFLGAVGLAAIPLAGRFVAGGEPDVPGDCEDRRIDRLEKPDAEWRRLLEPARYDILFRDRTEPAGSSPLDRESRAGTFICAACHLPIFESSTKFDSGTGWPSFYQPIECSVGTKRDWKLILPRTEYHCIRCGGHQGHVFGDGPPPTGQRYCNNGLALLFVPEGEPLPELRR